MNVGPQDGDTVLFCRHAKVGPDEISLRGLYHWIRSEPAATAVREPGNCEILVEWMCICDECRYRHSDAISACTQDARWIGEPPEIERIGLA